jgi:hypothetical protein
LPKGEDVNVPVKGGEPVIEPEVLESLEEAERSSGSRPGGAQGPFGPQGTVRPVGCTLGPGCGCIGLPLALAAGAVVSVFMALLWLLSLGRVPVSIVRMVQRLRQPPPRG